jgi:hypothetical protein
MSTSTVVVRPTWSFTRPTLRMITIAALVINALTFLVDIVASGPNEISVPHLVIALVVAGVAALRFRWAPAIGALLGLLLIVEP